MTQLRRLNAGLRWVRPWMLYTLAALHAAYLFWTALAGRIGPDPVNLLERAYGERAMWLLVATLAVTPLRRFAGVNLMPWRRALGQCSFFFALAHLAVFTFLDIGTVQRLAAEIVKRPYITVGMAAFVLLLPLALTSSDRAIRAMGALRWRSLHRLIYPAAVLVGVHNLWVAKGFQWQQVAWLLVILALMALRLIPRGKAQ